MPDPTAHQTPLATPDAGSVAMDLAGPPATVRLRILATSDLHMHLAAYDYFTDQPCAQKGLALTATLIAEARAEIPGTVLFDNGDFLQGSPLGDFVAQTGYQPHPCIAAMNHLGYDAVNLGNHEFSYGVDHLRATLAQAQFPCLSANTHTTSEVQAPFLPPTALITRHLPDAQGHLYQVTLGVIGVLPPQTAIWDKQGIDGAVRLTDMVQAVAQHVPRLRAEGADLVLVLAHSGIGPATPGPLAENAGFAIAALPCVDAVVLGHVHLPFPAPDAPEDASTDPQRGTLAGKPAVMPGVYGSHLGVIDLDLTLCNVGPVSQGGPSGRWTVTGHRTQARAIAPRDANGVLMTHTQPDPAVTALIAPAHRAALDWARKPIGRTHRAIHTYFAMITGSPALNLMNRAQSRYVATRLMGGAHAGLPLLSATAPFKAGGRGGPDNYTFVPSGDLLVRHAADLYIHPNTIVALRLTGAEVRHWLARAAQVFNRITPGAADQTLLNPDIASFHFDQISGVTYQIDLATPPGDAARIIDLRWRGHLVRDADPFILTTNSYRNSGLGGFLDASSARIVLADLKSNRDILIDYLTDGANLADADAATNADLAAPPAWCFAACPGATALFDSAPESLNFLPEVAHLNLTPLGTTAAGFQRYRLPL